MRVWLLGTEGRMAQMARVLKRSGHEVFFSGVGSPGTGRYARRLVVDLEKPNFSIWREVAYRHQIDLVVPGSENLLATGVVDELTTRDCLVFGPTKLAVRVEASKFFADRIMLSENIPKAITVWYGDGEYETALGAVRDHFVRSNLPIVIKPDGLTGGKGVVVAHNLTQAEVALEDLMVKGAHKGAGKITALAEYLSGPECSVFVLSDGHEDHAKFLAVARDCKPLYPAKDDQPAGPNTGGMWAISPIPEWTDELQQVVMACCVRPLLKAMREKGCPFRGLLYVALKLTPDGPKVIEYNGRPGDPEMQAVLERLERNLAEILMATMQGRLIELEIKMSSKVGGCLVICAKGYGSLDGPQLGKRINGIEAAEQLGVTVLHAGTDYNDVGELVTNGGRVLDLVASTDTIEELRDLLNRAATLISIEGGMEVRQDLGDPASAS